MKKNKRQEKKTYKIFYHLVCRRIHPDEYNHQKLLNRDI